MGRRRRRPSRPKQRREGPGHNEANRNTRESRQRSKYLDLGREAHFKYDVEQVLEASDVDEDRRLSLLQLIVTRGARNGVPETKRFLTDKVEEGIIDAPSKEKIGKLLDQYSTYR